MFVKPKNYSSITLLIKVKTLFIIKNFLNLADWFSLTDLNIFKVDYLDYSLNVEHENQRFKQKY